MQNCRAYQKVAIGVGGRILYFFTVATCLVAALISAAAAASDSSSRSKHEVFFAKTDHELHVYRIYGMNPGKTVLIIGGIHGNEPGGYLAADKYVDLSLRKGNLIIVPRANLHSILANDRGQNGDYNRKFDKELKEDDYDDQVIKVLKRLIEESDVLLNLHDGSGFYREAYFDEWHNPYRFGQSIIADCESFLSERSGEEIHLGEIARRVVARVNEQIPEEEYRFHFSNHDSISPTTRYPDMRKTATYFALTKNYIPAFGIETSKTLPNTEMKVDHQMLAINGFLAEFGVALDVPDRSVVAPRLDYVVVTVNGGEAFVVRDGGKLMVSRGDRVKIDHIVGNFERHMYADFEGLGGRNDNGQEFAISKPTRVKVRKDSEICGSLTIVPSVERAAARPYGSSASSASFILEVNGRRVLVPAGEELKLVRGDRLRVLDYLALTVPAGINVNFLGFVGDPQNNRGEDRGFLIDTAKDLLGNWSLAGEGKRYAIAVKLGKREITRMTLRLVEPELDYVVVRRNGDRPVVLQAGDRWHLQAGDKLTILGASSSAPEDETLRFRLFDSSGSRVFLEGNTFFAGSGGVDGVVRLSVMRGEVTMGSVRLVIEPPATSR